MQKWLFDCDVCNVLHCGWGVACGWLSSCAGCWCCSLTELHAAISSQTDVRSSDQLILFENHELRDVVHEVQLASLFPCTSPSNPLYLFSISDAVDTAVPSSVDSVLSATVRKWRGSHWQHPVTTSALMVVFLSVFFHFFSEKNLQ